MLVFFQFAIVLRVSFIQIGQYRAEKDFHDLVPEQAHKERLQELHLLDDMDVSECYHSLLAMMRAVFHENEIERPSAYELLHWDVMLKGRDVRILDM